MLQGSGRHHETVPCNPPPPHPTHTLHKRLSWPCAQRTTTCSVVYIHLMRFGMNPNPAREPVAGSSPRMPVSRHCSSQLLHCTPVLCCSGKACRATQRMPPAFSALAKRILRAIRPDPYAYVSTSTRNCNLLECMCLCFPDGHGNGAGCFWSRSAHDDGPWVLPCCVTQRPPCTWRHQACIPCATRCGAVLCCPSACRPGSQRMHPAHIVLALRPNGHSPMHCAWEAPLPLLAQGRFEMRHARAFGPFLAACPWLWPLRARSHNEG